jgi:hypothetical protein
MSRVVRWPGRAAGWGAVGLQRHDIDPLQGTVTVARQANEITGQGQILTAPKSEAGNRTEALPVTLLESLVDHLASYVAAPPDSPVFTRKTGLPLRRQDLSHVVGRCVQGRRDKRCPYSRPPAPCVDHRRPQSKRDAPGTDGLRWSLIPCCRFALPTCHGRARKGHCLIP